MKQPRNSLCQCGSNKKFKYCCGNEAELSRKHQEAMKPLILPVERQSNTPRLRPRERTIDLKAAILIAAALGGFHRR